MVGAVYLDLSKAFDTIGHGVLIEKLVTYGVNGSELDWFIDYLFARSQIVEIGNVCSEPAAITCGVPQGSILGPLLFILFFNDLIDTVVNINVIKYADDTVIYYASKNVQEIENILNSQMKIIGHYCEENELILNLKKGKTEAMLFGTQRRLKNCGKELCILFNGTKITFVDRYVYLGNTLDSNLSLNTNFETSYKRASSRLRLLKQIRYYLTEEAATKIYNAMIIPILTYPASLKPTQTMTQSGKMASLQERATFITKNNNIRNASQDICRQNCMLVKKCINKELTSYEFDNYFQILTNYRQTRNSGYSIKLPSVKLELARKSFYFGAAKLFNSLPLEIRAKQKTSEFRCLLKSYKF